MKQEEVTEVRTACFTARGAAAAQAVCFAAEEAENRLEQLLQEAEDSGPATDMTAQDWAEIEDEGSRRLRSQKLG